MRAPNDTDQLEFKGWILRTRAAEVTPPRQLLLIHGWTGDENSMWVFARHLPRDFQIVAPRAPHPTKPSGFSWRVGPPTPGTFPNLDDLKPAVGGLLSLLDSFAAEYGLSSPEWNIMGFSQGGVVAAALALLFPERVERMALLASFVPHGVEGLAAARPLRGKQVFIAHGSFDEMVNIELGREAVRVLESAGARVELCEDEIGHKVSAPCMRKLELFFA